MRFEGIGSPRFGMPSNTVVHVGMRRELATKVAKTVPPREKKLFK